MRNIEVPALPKYGEFSAFALLLFQEGKNTCTRLPPAKHQMCLNPPDPQEKDTCQHLHVNYVVSGNIPQSRSLNIHFPFGWGGVGMIRIVKTRLVQNLRGLLFRTNLLV